MDATSGGIVRSGVGTLTFKAKAGIQMNDNLSGTVNAQMLHINADSNGSGSGTFTLAASKTLDSTNGVLYLTSADIQVIGNIDSGTASIHLHTTNQRTIGIGLNNRGRRYADLRTIG